ncbi:MAG: carbohydrate kinase [Planctomycetota bacterium]
MDQEAERWVIVGLGEVLWDELPGGRRLGGAPANFAYHARALGAEAVVVSCVGEDEAGDEILVRLAAAGIDIRHVAVDPLHPTGRAMVALDAAGAPAFVIAGEAAWDHIPWDAGLGALARRADVVCYGTLAQRSPVSRCTIRSFLDGTRRHCLRLCDANLRSPHYDRPTVHELLRRTNVLKLSEEELDAVAGLLDIQGSEDGLLAELAHRYSLLMIVLTRGAAGSRLFAPLESARHPGIAARVVDTVGAGDSFGAAVAVGLLHGWPLDLVGARANRLASFVCTQAGAMPPIPADLAVPFHRRPGG